MRPRRAITRRQILRATAGSALAAVGLATAKPRRGRAKATAKPPNFVFILSDNHRWDAMGSMGHPFVLTPNLDSIGREGLHFVNAFCTTPLCSPARASFLTGLYAYRHGIHNHTTRAAWDEGHTTFLELLKRDAGYATAFIGKWHMPGSGVPRLRGVDHFVTFTVEGGQGRYFDCPLVVDGEPQASRKPYITEELTNRAAEFIARHYEQPFCVYLSHKAAHHPWQAAPDLEGMYADEPVDLPHGANSWTGLTNGQIWGGFDRTVEAAYRSCMETVTSMDRELGTVLDTLDDLEVADDTVLIYASDNGFLFGEHKRVELRWPFEEVIRIPFLLRYPRLVPPRAERVEPMVLNIDLAPTLLELAGVQVPDAMQGMSFVPFLTDPSAAGRRAWLLENYTEFPYRVPAYQGVRTERYLYVEYDSVYAPTLHDVRHDPKQTKDLYGTQEGASIVAELKPMLEALRRGERVDG